MRRKDRQLSAEYALDICDRCSYATIAMIDNENMPYCVSVNIVRHNNIIYFHSAKKGFKNDSLLNNNNVCISCVALCKVIQERFTTEYESAIVRGTASAIVDESERIKALKLLCERYTPNAMNMFENELTSSLKATEVYRIDIQYITGKGNLNVLP